ncbi:MAG: hypothetical protein JRJ62_00260 [Deltaproteobacteria bacterium]|nr:hypothetical protein [Deltaproteobacteria bacterium]
MDEGDRQFVAMDTIERAKLLHPVDIQGLIEVAEQVEYGNFNQLAVIGKARRELLKIKRLLK